jgi:hypothetical protein
MPRRDLLDLRNGIILTFLVVIVVLYTKLLHQNITITTTFSPEQRAYDNSQNFSFDESLTPSINATPPPILYESETTHFDGLIKYTRTTPNTTPNLLILVLTKDAASWGQDPDKPPRTFYDFLDLLITTNINLTTTSLALWTSSPEQYHLFRTATTHLPQPLARLSIFLDPTPDDTINRANRHAPSLQSTRRSTVARLRNKLLLHALGPEPHHLWLDSDIQYLSPGIIQLLLFHSASNPDAGIITARCQDGPTYNYDKNAWAGGRLPGPGPEFLSADPAIAAAEAETKSRLVDELIHGTKDNDLIPLDAVGGTILYMRASLVWEGLNFPSYYTVGTRWGRDGWDGIETEGLCYVARKLDGGGCYVLGGKNYVMHTN